MKSFEKSAGHWKKIVSANSFDKAFEVHQAFAKETFDATVAEFSKLGEIYASAAKSAFKRYEASVDAVDVKPTEASVGSVHIKLYEASVNAVNVKPTDASLAAVDVKPYEVSVDAVDVKPTEASLAAVDVKPYEASVGSVGVKARVKK